MLQNRICATGQLPLHLGDLMVRFTSTWLNTVDLKGREGHFENIHFLRRNHGLWGWFMRDMLQLQLFRHFKFTKYFDSHGFASPMVQVVGPEVLPLGHPRKKRSYARHVSENVSVNDGKNSTVKFLCFTRRSVEGKKEHAPGWEFCFAFCWAQQTLDFQGVQTISTNGEDIFKATRVSEFEFAGGMKHKTVFGWLAIRSWTWWMVDQVSPSKQQKAPDMQSDSVRSLVKLQLSAQCGLVFKEMKPQKMKRFPGWTKCWKKGSMTS